MLPAVITKGRDPGVPYSDEIAKDFCEHIAEGGTVRGFCALPGTPCKRSIFNWLGTRKDFALLYAAATEMKAEAFAEEMIDIADSDMDPVKVRNMIHSRQWLAERLKPRRYGLKASLEHSGEVAATVVIRQFTPAPFAMPLADAEIA